MIPRMARRLSRDLALSMWLGVLLVAAQPIRATHRADPDPLDSQLSADRPGFSIGPDTVAKGHAQIEGGIEYTVETSALFNTVVPQLLFRYGWREQIELRVEWDGYEWKDEGAQSTSGLTDVELQVKGRLRSRDKNLDLAWLGGLSLLVGSSDISSDSVDPSFGFLWSYSISEKTGVFGELGSTLIKENDKRLVKLEPSVGLERLLSDKVQVFLEEAAYFSIVTFTTLGYGDITLDTEWRMLIGIEAVNGLLLAGWSTALLFTVVQRSWKMRHTPKVRKEGTQ